MGEKLPILPRHTSLTADFTQPLWHIAFASSLPMLPNMVLFFFFFFLHGGRQQDAALGLCPRRKRRPTQGGMNPEMAPALAR